MLTNSCKKEEYNKPSVPVLATYAITDLTSSTATCGGKVINEGADKVTKRGVCWSIGEVPTIDDSRTFDGNDTGSFSSAITGLSPNNIYFIRAYATNSIGTGYGKTVSFTTGILFNPKLIYGTVTDIDGIIYKTINIGTQTWMAENLKVTHYSNGDAITHIINENDWDLLKTEAYCVYLNAMVYSNTYGNLYNWYAVSDSRNLAPIGWHIPTIGEWTTLIDYLGGDSIACNKLKETGKVHWICFNDSANNESGFTALPGGECGYSKYVNYIGYWWSITEDLPQYTARYIIISYDRTGVYNTYQSLYCGFSVRCIKDK